MAHDLQRKLSYSDLVATPDSGKRYELVRGELIVSPSPSPVHQRVSRRLGLVLVAYVEERSLGEMFYAPIDLILTEHDVFVPDLLVVESPQHISKRGIEGPPLLVVEILSPSTRHHDLGVKSRRYAELGARHYWIVDPDAERFECYRLVEGGFRSSAQATGNTTLCPPDWDGLEIDLAALWR